MWGFRTNRYFTCCGDTRLTNTLNWWKTRFSTEKTKTNKIFCKKPNLKENKYLKTNLQICCSKTAKMGKIIPNWTKKAESSNHVAGSKGTLLHPEIQAVKILFFKHDNVSIEGDFWGLIMPKIRAHLSQGKWRETRVNTRSLWWNRFTRWQRFSSPTEPGCVVDVFAGRRVGGQGGLTELGTALRSQLTRLDAWKRDGIAPALELLPAIIIFRRWAGGNSMKYKGLSLPMVITCPKQRQY